MYTFSYEEQRRKLPESLLVFYPYLVTEWAVTYKPLPFTKQRTEKKMLISNLVKKETSLFEIDKKSLVPFEKEDDSLTLPGHYPESEITEVGFELLKNYYMHKRKVWSYPKPDMVKSYLLYIPYLVYTKTVKGEERTYFFETFSGSEDLLDKYKEVESYLKEREVIK
ncbi:hypothetical protein [Planococcus lenghuensis]|uniref:Uncharacterized protein n=1 Tax=Planococcus lenghuensis TaxID=2213202 RepID=A0A1Q2L2R5_9BACL|nr:hypothetical protein [Planococcus lenghuensis]AQQ54706.1 hypothetical protein B0X71_17415 [Planococcus lenghuensis]